MTPIREQSTAERCPCCGAYGTVIRVAGRRVDCESETCMRHKAENRAREDRVAQTRVTWRRLA